MVNPSDLNVKWVIQWTGPALNLRLKLYKTEMVLKPCSQFDSLLSVESSKPEKVMSQLIQTRIQFQHHHSPIEKEDTFSLSDGDTDSEGEIDRY